MYYVRSNTRADTVTVTVGLGFVHSGQRILKAPSVVLFICTPHMHFFIRETRDYHDVLDL